MTAITDQNSLLIPLAMDAWVIDAQTQQTTAWYYANYNNLSSFQSPIPPPFASSSGTPVEGIHLHWALPDALTHGVQNTEGAVEFPLVPNRWLIARFNTDTSLHWNVKAWVVQSDYQQPGSGLSGSGAGAFLDTLQPSGISNDGSTVTINPANIGRSLTVEAWQAQGEQGGDLFLQAVGPGNISFAAYKPFSENVFSFIDNASELENGTYSYMVVGWYSEPDGCDPLSGVNTYNAKIWENEADWQNQTQAMRFSFILNAMKWSLSPGSSVPSSPPCTSLYHSFKAAVSWPYHPDGSNDAYPDTVQIAVGKTASDALSALIQNYASIESQTDPDNSTAWITAGNTLSTLIQAASLDLLDDFGKPGGATLVQQKIEQSWFGSDTGGTVWQVASLADDVNKANATATDITLTTSQQAALLQQLSALNSSQQSYDLSQNSLQSQQAELYRLWLKLSQSQNFGWGETPTTVPDFETVLQDVLQNNLYPELFNQVWNLCCSQASAQSALPDPTDNTNATAWANSHWTFPDALGTGIVTLAELGLELKASQADRYWHPVDPVVLISSPGRNNKHGQDGSFNPDGTLTCRLPGQTIIGISVNGLPAITSTQLATVNFNPLLQFTQVPSIPGLLTEAFFSDPANAGIMASAAKTSSTSINAAISALLNVDTHLGNWQGISPSPLAYALWQQAWSPLYLEWMVKYYPTVTDTFGHFDFSSWVFDGNHYQWKGSGINAEQPFSLAYQGRTLISPYAQQLLKDKLKSYLSTATSIDSSQMEQLLSTVMNWDILGQSLSGFTDQLITLLALESFPPPSSGTPVSCPADPNAPKPLVGDLIQGHYQLLSELNSGTTGYHNNFFPILGGLVCFQTGKFQMVDAFGQTFDLSQPNTPQGFQPLISSSLLPPAALIPKGLNAPFMFTPNLVQSARLNMAFLSNDHSGNNILTSTNNNPVCGWLLPNYLDNSLAVYHSNGELLGELGQQNWRPRPGAAGNNPPPATPAQITNVCLQQLINSLASQTPDTLSDFMQVLDETLWMINPSSDSNTCLAALIGRPLAVVQMQLSLELKGEIATNQLWNYMLTADSTTDSFTQVADTGGVLDLAVPVRLGSLGLRNDGLIGYFLNSTDGYSRFYTVHTSPEVSTKDGFIQPIVTSSAYQGDISVKPNGSGITLTLILDPRGQVHATSGLLPVCSVALDSLYVQNFLKTLLVNFQTGPILADPGILRTPQPAENQGTWSWLQQINGVWEQDTLVDSDDTARFPSQPPTLREGWLQLSLINKNQIS